MVDKVVDVIKKDDRIILIKRTLRDETIDVTGTYISQIGLDDTSKQ